MKDIKTKRKVRIKVESLQTDLEGNRQHMKTDSTGQLLEREGILFVLYQEKMEGVDAPVKNLLKAEPVERDTGEEDEESGSYRIILEKTGGVSWMIIFEEGKRHESNYDTPYGPISMGVKTDTVSLQRSEEKICLNIGYTLFVQGKKQAACEIKIEMRKEI